MTVSLLHDCSSPPVIVSPVHILPHISWPSIIRRGEESGYVAECVEIAVVTQGETLDDVTRNLQEAVSLHLEGEDLTVLGLAPNPTMLVTMELMPAYA